MLKREPKEILIVAGYPKTGNTQLASSLLYAAKDIKEDWEVNDWEWDIHTFYRRNLNLLKIPITPKGNPYLGKNKVIFLSHWRGDISWLPKNLFYRGKVTKVIITNRNPYDTLLSSLNYLKRGIINNGMSNIIKKTLKILLPTYYFSNLFKDYANNFTLQYLRDNGLLDEALINFANINTLHPLFSKNSGKFISFYDSYNNSNIPLLKTNYEKIYESGIKDNFNNISRDISNFLSTEKSTLQNGLIKQNNFAMEESKKENSFYKMVKPYYFSNYFSEKAIKYFNEKLYKEMIVSGYEYLLNAF